MKTDHQRHFMRCYTYWQHYGSAKIIKETKQEMDKIKLQSEEITVEKPPKEIYLAIHDVHDRKEDTFSFSVKDNFPDGTSYKYIRADLVDKLIEALNYYADTDNWRAPNGGGSENIFKWEEEFKNISFNGYDVAEETLNLYEKG